MGVWQVATAVGRAVGMKLSGQQTAPNLFVLLVGGPGAGKSQAVSAARQIILPAIPKMSLIPASVTRAGLIDYMTENLQSRLDPSGMTIPSNECIALSDEMQGILPELNDIGHLTLYNELYDIKSTYKSRTRTSGEFTLQSPYCSIITGAQPAFFATSLPEQAWGMGFMSRSIMVFETQRERKDIFLANDIDHALKTKLIQDLREIHGLHGWFKWMEKAKALYREWWVEQGGPPVPQNKRLAMGYNTRRPLHFIKLAMIFSLSRSNDLIVTATDAARAIELLTRTEDRMRHIFAEMTATGTIAAYGDVIDTLRARASNGAILPEADLIHMLMERFPPSQINSIIEHLLGSEVVALAPGKTEVNLMRSFVPGNKLALL